MDRMLLEERMLRRDISSAFGFVDNFFSEYRATIGDGSLGSRRTFEGKDCMFRRGSLGEGVNGSK